MTLISNAIESDEFKEAIPIFHNWRASHAFPMQIMLDLLKGVAIFAKDCFGHPSLSNRQKLNAANQCLRRPSRPASLD